MTPDEIAAELRALADRIAQPAAPMSEAVGDGLILGADDIQWGTRLRNWQKSKFWHHDWGPAPGEPRCWVPAHLIKKMAA